MHVVMLEDTYRTFVSHEPEDQFAKAVWWVEGNAYSLPGFSFKKVRENLDLDHETWRSMLLQLAREDPSKRRKPKELSRQRMRRISASG